MKIEYIADDRVTELIDLQLRHLLSLCFVKERERFSQQRYFLESPKHRYFVRDENDNIIAHVAVHEKSVLVGPQSYSVAGIAEVCVHPNNRKKGLVGILLKRIHTDMTNEKMAFSILFGDDCIYHSSGYREVTNLLMQTGRSWVPVNAMARGLKERWPESSVQLSGPKF